MHEYILSKIDNSDDEDMLELVGQAKSTILDICSRLDNEEK